MKPLMKPAHEVAVGRVFLHPDTHEPVRRVEPRGECPGLNATGAVLGVDEDGGLYAIDPARPVEVPFHVRLLMEDDPEACVIVASFERPVDDDEGKLLRRNVLEGRITADPDSDLPLALMQQLALEMRAAYDEGMVGRFQAHRVHLRKKWNYKAMCEEHA